MSSLLVLQKCKKNIYKKHITHSWQETQVHSSAYSNFICRLHEESKHQANMKHA